MYYVKYSIDAYNDINDSFNYIFRSLNNINYFNKLMNKIDYEINIILKFPYSLREHNMGDNKYRVSIIDNYGLFYRIDEENNVIEIIRFISFKRDIKKIKTMLF